MTPVNCQVRSTFVYNKTLSSCVRKEHLSNWCFSLDVLLELKFQLWKIIICLFSTYNILKQTTYAVWLVHLTKV